MADAAEQVEDLYAEMTRPALARPTPRGRQVRNPATGEFLPPDGEVVDAVLSGPWPAWARIGLVALDLLRDEEPLRDLSAEPELPRVERHLLGGTRKQRERRGRA